MHKGPALNKGEVGEVSKKFPYGQQNGKRHFSGHGEGRRRNKRAGEYAIRCSHIYLKTYAYMEL